MRLKIAVSVVRFRPWAPKIPKYLKELIETTGKQTRPQCDGGHAGGTRSKRCLACQRCITVLPRVIAVSKVAMAFAIAQLTFRRRARATWLSRMMINEALGRRRRQSRTEAPSSRADARSFSFLEYEKLLSSALPVEGMRVGSRANMSIAAKYQSLRKASQLRPQKPRKIPPWI
jgi:hypothetical protein